MTLTRKFVWAACSRVYVRYSKALNRQVTSVRRDVDRIRHFAVDPLAFKFDFDFNESDI